MVQHMQFKDSNRDYNGKSGLHYISHSLDNQLIMFDSLVILCTDNDQTQCWILALLLKCQN